MDWQLVVVLVLVGAAALYLARSAWRSWSGAKGGCGGGCGCPAGPASGSRGADAPRVIPVEQVTLRRRDAGPL